ncbi:hypothetical protein Y600_5840 [Burkholderia pseudomallei MSHR3709]|nr:hypothetical protein Y600_5840 [Burkholderia pseudomallei MSHR3709]
MISSLISALRFVTSLSSARRLSRNCVRMWSSVRISSSMLAVWPIAAFFATSSSFSAFSQKLTVAAAFAKSSSVCRSVLIDAMNVSAAALNRGRLLATTLPSICTASVGKVMIASAFGASRISRGSYAARSFSNCAQPARMRSNQASSGSTSIDTVPLSVPSEHEKISRFAPDTISTCCAWGMCSSGSTPFSIEAYSASLNCLFSQVVSSSIVMPSHEADIRPTEKTIAYRSSPSASSMIGRASASIS